MKIFSVIVVAVLVSSSSGQDIVFGDSSTEAAIVNRAAKIGEDSVVVEAAGLPPNPEDREVNPRFFPGLFTGVNGLFGGIFGSLKHKDACLNYCGVGNPHLSSQCCSLGFSQCCVVGGGVGIGGGFGGIGGGFGGPGLVGGVKPGVCPGLFGFRSNNVNEDGGVRSEGGFFRNAEANEATSRVRRDDSIRFAGENSEAAAAENPEVNPRFFGLFDGLFGKKCVADFECPGQLKCCNDGFKRTCKQPSFFG